MKKFIRKLRTKVGFTLMLCVVIAVIVFIVFQFKQESTKYHKQDEAVEVSIEEINDKRNEIEYNLKVGGGEALQQAITLPGKPISLAFSGMVDTDTMGQILKQLEQCHITASFFVPTIKAVENNEVLKSAKEAGHILGNYELLGDEKVEQLQGEELIGQFARTNAMFEKILGEQPTLLMCNMEHYKEEVLRVAQASGYIGVVDNAHHVNFQSFGSYKEVLNYVKSLSEGDIVTIKLDSPIEEWQYEPKKETAQPAVDKQASVVATPESESTPQIELSEMEALIRLVEWFAYAIEEVDYDTSWLERYNHYEEERIANEGKLATVIDHIYTTQKGLAFTFCRINNKETLDYTLEALKSLDAKATFFITGKEALAYPERVAYILKEGHEVGNAGFIGVNLDQKSFEEVCEEIHKGEKVLERLGIKTDLFTPFYGNRSDALDEAVSAMGYKMITYNSAPAKEVYQTLEAKEIVADYYKTYNALRRGDIIYLRMDYYEEVHKVGDIVKEVYAQKIAPIAYSKPWDLENDSGYHLMTIQELLKDTYTYPVPEAKEVIKLIQPGQLKPEDAWEMIKTRYIGSPSMQTPASLVGFSEEEIEYLNTEGLVDTGGENVIFLTFDDWGSDIGVNHLLYVLEKHQIETTFFIRSNFVSHNPNLLRAVAEAGHDVANHTLNHYRIDIGEDKVKELQEDLVESHVRIANAVADMEELKLLFRPPTLAVTRVGIQTVLDCGFTYVINGDLSTHDYEAKSVKELKDKLDHGVVREGKLEPLKPGSVVVMHMQDDSKYTAEAVDLFLTENEKKSDDDPTKYKFAKLSDYLK